MLSRGVSDASTRPRRSRSSTSVNRRRTAPLVRDTIDAATARRHAMTAAHIAMDRANERASAELRRPAELTRNQSNASRTGTGATPRSQNIRFCDVAESRRPQSILLSKASTAASSVHMPASSSYSQLSRVGNGPPLNEFGVADGYGSTPSSYRRLRKTKSMLTPQKRGPSLTDLSSHSPGTPRTLRNVKSSASDHDHGLRLGLKRSISFLKLNSGNLSRTFKRSHSTSDHNDAAVERARDQFMQDVEQQRLQKKPSFFATRKVRQQRSFRKTVRPNGTTESNDGIPSEYQQAKQESIIRSFSASLRDKIRRALGRSISKEIDIPAQQMEASRAHFRDYLDGTDINVGHEEYAAGNSNSGSRGSLYIPSSQKEESMEDLEAISRSLRSMHSSDSLHSNGRSRVTSWTNSTMTSSLPGRSTPIERKRLSIIQEHGGPHQPSSSIGRHMDEVSATHLPLSARHGTGQVAGPVDSQRVYSALMKRIDQEQDQHHGAKTPKPGLALGTRQNFTSSGQSFRTAPTIRRVTSEESIHIVAPDEQHRHFSLHAPSWHETDSKTPQQIAMEHERAERRKTRITIPEPQSSFFPFSSENKPQTPSPFKLALAARRERQASSEEENASVIINRPSAADNGFETNSESQYSRTTSGQLPMASLDQSDPDLNDEPAGIATIIPARVNRHPRPTAPLAQVQKTKPTASVEWKSWMNNQMTNLDRRNSKSSNSHFREGAQINGDDTAIGGRPGRQASVRTAKENETPTHHRRSSLMNDRFPLLELKEVPRNNTPKPKRTSSVTRLATSAAADVKRASLAALGVNDENARLSSTTAPSTTTTSGGTMFHPLRAKYSQPSSFKSSTDEPISTPGRLQNQLQHQHQYHQQGAARRLARPPSSITIRSQYGRITEMSSVDDGDDYDDYDGEGRRDLRTTSRLSRPFTDSGYAGGGDGGSGNGSMRTDRFSRGPPPPPPRPPPRHLAADDQFQTAYERDDTALPMVGGVAGSSEKRRELKLGRAAVTTLSSRRMVSNFLRSRRRMMMLRLRLFEEYEVGGGRRRVLRYGGWYFYMPLDLRWVGLGWLGGATRVGTDCMPN
jgi:hypothetical protein